MEKTNVTNGVYWIEIPDVSLFILCGCPADVIKHLMKRGLIVTKEKNGISYETGPNAILLSDIPLQKGSFSNLAEFPVLQMFYRQGMILPNHPNNTGVKPLLMGSRASVDAQSHYVYRGNYGLASLEEIMETGIQEEQAKEMMRLKMRFAFDRIKKTEELVDTRIVDKHPVELRDGVFVRRREPNIFEIMYKDESATVDLNLSDNEKYEPAYQLGFHTIRREYFSVVHTGEGDGWDINRPCMASILSFQGRLYLIDAGPNIQHSLTALGINVNDIEGIFHTHAHDDHFAGLTTLVRSDHQIKYYATQLVRASVEKKLAALMSMDERNFSKYFEICDLEFDTWNNIEGLEVKPVFSPHPVETSIFFFRTLWEGGYKSYAHFADIVSFGVLTGMITDDELKSGVTQEYFDTVKHTYLTPADLKKIDIGGGLIHGKAEDFAGDGSQRTILCHVARPLTDSEKEIGSSATFGMQDVLIATEQDYSLRAAHQYLQSYFPNVPPHEIRMLLNCPIVAYNAGSILIRNKTVCDNVYLTLRGVVEFIDSETDINNSLSTGSIMGELSVLTGKPVAGTYRASSYIQTLKMPADLYLEFIRRNGLYDSIKRIHNNRLFLRSTWLFGEMTSYPVQNQIAQHMKRSVYGQGQDLPISGKPDLFLLESGGIELYFDGKTIEALSTGGFCGEESVLYGKSALFKARFTKESKGCHISADLLEDIPIVQWKLLETYERRLRKLDPHRAFSAVLQDSVT